MSDPNPNDPPPNDPPPGDPPADPPPNDPPADPPPGDPPADPPGNNEYFKTLPDNWRNQLAGGDEKRAGQLERVLDMNTLVDNYFNAQDKIRSGEISNGLPENPTDEQVADWRAANGVPEAADKYELTLTEGLSMDASDKRVMDHVYTVAHEHNVSSTALSAITSAMLTGNNSEAQAALTEDGVDMQTGERQLRDTWGQDYETNVNMVKSLTAQLPESMSAAFEGARMADGKKLFSSPEFMVFMADTARKLNPAGVVVPNSNNPIQAIKDEKKSLEARMGDDDWHKDHEAQKRYQDLVDAEMLMNKQ